MALDKEMRTPLKSEATLGATSRNVRSPVELVNEYLNSFYVGDFVKAGAVVAHDFAFSGPFIQVEGKKKFLESASGLREIVRGHRLLRQWSDVNDVSSIYEVTFETPFKKGSVVMSEWHVHRAGELVSAQLFFDAAAFRDLVSPS
jgi:hypothetical protein